jgi:hypothetical protein
VHEAPDGGVSANTVALPPLANGAPRVTSLGAKIWALPAFWAAADTAALGHVACVRLTTKSAADTTVPARARSRATRRRVGVRVIMTSPWKSVSSLRSSE